MSFKPGDAFYLSLGDRNGRFVNVAADRSVDVLDSDVDPVGRVIDFFAELMSLAESNDELRNLIMKYQISLAYGAEYREE